MSAADMFAWLYEVVTLRGVDPTDASVQCSFGSDHEYVGNSDFTEITLWKRIHETN